MSHLLLNIATLVATPFRHLPGRHRGVLLAGGALLFSIQSPLHAQSVDDNQRWVSDSLSTYVRSGPTDGYRIVGTLSSGQQVELLDTQGSYSRVRAEGGNAVWIPTAELQSTPGPAERLPALEQQLADLSSELASINEGWELRVQGMQETLESRRALIDELEQARNQLSAELTETQSELRATQARLGEENQEMMMSYMVYGGGIAGAGLLAGLLLPSLVRRRKRDDGWV
jgi:SH3 domain protein